jgi:hypothetical protein
MLFRIYPIWIFWFENMVPSGNPALEIVLIEKDNFSVKSSNYMIGRDQSNRRHFFHSHIQYEFCRVALEFTIRPKAQT